MLQSTKINIQVPNDLLYQIDEYVSAIGTNRSSIIREAMANYLEDKRQKELEELMREGYQATAELDLRIQREFEHIDSELGWDY